MSRAVFSTHRRDFGMWPGLVLLIVLLIAGCTFEGAAPDDAEAGGSEARASSPADGIAGGEVLQGTVAGRPFQVADAKLRDGILEVRQGEDFFADLEVTLFLFLDRGELPEGKRWLIGADDSEFGNPHVHVAYRDRSRSLPASMSYMDGYALDLRFGKAEGLRIPVEMRLQIAGSAPTDLSGAFVADVEGLVLRGGIADRQSDGILTIEWVADRWLEDEVGGEVEVVEHRGTMFHHTGPGGGLRTGWTEVEYRSGPGAELEEARFLLVKGDDGWTVDHRFGASALRQAHPLDEPSVADPFRYLPFVAARDLEQKYAGQPIYDAEFETSVGAEEGQVEVSYRVGDREAETKSTSYRFVRGEEATWRQQ